MDPQLQEAPTESVLWVYMNAVRSGPVTEVKVTKHVLRISFDKTVASSFSRIRVLLAKPTVDIFLKGIWSSPQRLGLGTRHETAGLPAADQVQSPDSDLVLVVHLHCQSWLNPWYPLEAVLQIREQPSSIDEGTQVRILHETAFGTSDLSTLLVPLDLALYRPFQSVPVTYYYIHVAPCRPLHPLPPILSLEHHMITRIIQHCLIGEDAYTQGKLLLNLSLISKWWQQPSQDYFDVVSLNLMTDERYLDAHTLSMAATLILQRPSRGIGIELLPQLDFLHIRYWDEEGPQYHGRWLPRLHILYAHLPDLTEISADPHLISRAAKELSRLTKVWRLTSELNNAYDHADWDQWEGSMDCDFGTLLETINKWDALEEMRLQGFRNYGTRDPRIPEEKAQYRLTYLSLSAVQCTWHQIHHIIFRPDPQLTQLVLDQVEGLSAPDYHRLLQLSASAIEYLSIKCIVGPDVEDVLHGQRPLDMVIAGMPNLQKVVVPSDLASNLSLESGNPGNDAKVLRTEFTILRYGIDDLDPTTDYAGLGLEESLRRTKWNAVSIAFRAERLVREQRLMRWNCLNNARNIAESRSITFHSTKMSY